MVTWEQLPGTVRAAVQAHTGPISDVQAAPDGAGSDLTVTLHTGHGLVFCKGIQADHPLVRMHRTEARAAGAGVGPRLRWQLEADGWLLLGLEHIAGRHAALPPGSADLPLLADALERTATLLTPSPMDPVQPLAARWAPPLGWAKLAGQPPAWLDDWTRDHVEQFAHLERAAPALVDGDTLVHTDPAPQNWLIDGERARLVDWAWPARGAAWVDTALLTIRLLDVGHTAEQAERWARTVPVYADARAAAVTVAAIAIAGLWTLRAGATGRQHELAVAAQQWARYRLTHLRPAGPTGTIGP
ncbi:hypothetical protein Athai_12430 [Actinocatenispora thailandica]|uniref:Aminoglycoside phosphotransferase n=1 Tax=Actinocatenispora thailandica TaxID=227318 RepID=A0A7R7DLH6_9ACTN|nr:hypothetical protein [Actinocatenispora thailandica]BCJ33740.1 hypothetical protein Athai_12430 [Actinocatenispora thailandica]